MTPTRSRSIKYRIYSLVFIIIAPLLVVFAVVALSLASANRDTIELRLQSSTKELSSAVDSDFIELQGVLSGFAASLEINSADPVEFTQKLAEKAKLSGIVRMWLLSKSGEPTQQFLDAAGATPIRKLDDKLVARVFAGKPAASNVAGEGMSAATIVIAVPVFNNGEIVSGLAAEVRAAHFNHAFDEAGMKPNWLAAVLDQSGNFVARSVDADNRLGTPARPEARDATSGAVVAGRFENVSLEGRSVLNSFLRSDLTQWTSIVAVPKSELDAPLWGALAYTILGGLSALGLSLLAATVMAARIAQPVANLSRHAAALAEGQMSQFEKYRITEIESVRTSLDKAMAQSARLAALAAASGDAIVGVDFESRIEAWNKGAEEIFGYTAEEVIGRPKSILLPAELKEEFDAQRLRILNGEVIRGESVRLRKNARRIDVEFVDAPIFDSFGRITGYSTTIRDITERTAYREHRQLLLRELAHRTKNQLAVIQSIAQQTKRNSSSLDGFIDAFNGRIQGLAASHDILAKQQWHAIPIKELVHTQVAVLVTEIDRLVTISGPDIALNAVHAEALGLALHELITNSIKYGALSVDAGRVAISWKLLTDVEPNKILFTWLETGGPRIRRPPIRRGFGSKVLNEIVGLSLGGEPKTEFRPSGLYWEISWEPKL